MDRLAQWIGGHAPGGVIVLLLLLLTVSLRLYHSRRKKAYFTLLLAVAFMLAEYGLRIAHAESAAAGNAWVPFWIHVLQICAFITIHMGIYQLYNRLTGRHVLIGLVLLALTGVIAWLVLPSGEPGTNALAPDANTSGPDTNAPPLNLTPAPGDDSLLALDLYLLVLLPLAYGWIIRAIGQTGKYSFGIGVYLVMHVSHIGLHLMDEPHPLLKAAEAALPIAFLFVLVLMVIDRLVELLQAVYVSSITDGLTGLYTRSFLQRRLAQYLQRGYRVGVIFCDIDNFKRLNDTQGHKAGDEALKHVARILLEEVEDIGFAGRYGGEEMVAVITSPKAKTAEVAEAIRSRVERDTGVTVSVGWSTSGKQTGAETLLKQADEAMYHSKTHGKNRVTSYQQMKKAEKSDAM